jgi:phage shock protein E
MKTTFWKIFAGTFLALIFNSAFADPIWIDVRSLEEFNKDHIEGDTHIPLAELAAEKLTAQYGKDAELMLYCRSGNRAGQAKQLLDAAGFTKVTNAGSIDEVRTLRGLKLEAQNSPASQ